MAKNKTFSVSDEALNLLEKAIKKTGLKGSTIVTNGIIHQCKKLLK